MLDVENKTALHTPDGVAPEPLEFRDEQGGINPASVSVITEAIEASRRSACATSSRTSTNPSRRSARSPRARAAPRLIELLGRDFDFAALTEVDEAVREEILEELETATVAEGVRDLDSDDAITILESLPEDEQAEVLDQLPAIERVALQRSLDYPEDSAGRRMQTEFIAVPPFWTVGQTIDFMRETARPAGDLLRDFRHRSRGPAPRLGALDRLLRSKRPVTHPRIMNDEPDRVEATQQQEEVARLFERYNLVSAAVVDEAGRLVGVILVDDIVDVLEEEADADIKQLGGVNPTKSCRTRSSTSREPLPLALRQSRAPPSWPPASSASSRDPWSGWWRSPS